MTITVIEIPGMKLVNTLNAREHHHAKGRRVKAERTLVAYSLRSVAVRSPVSVPCVVMLTRCYTGQAKEMDPSDNLPAAFKGVLDEVARWIGADDRKGSGIEWRHSQERGKTNAVRIEIEAKL